MKSFPIFAVCVAAALGSPSRCANERQPQSLFNGKDLSGWHVDVPAADTNARIRNPFIVRNGMLVSLGENGIKRLLSAQPGLRANPTAPAKGLFLVEVQYSSSRSTVGHGLRKVGHL